MLSPTRHCNGNQQSRHPANLKVLPSQAQPHRDCTSDLASSPPKQGRAQAPKEINIKRIAFDLIKTEGLDEEDKSYLREGVAKMQESLRKPCYPLSAFCLYSMERRDVLKDEGMSSLKIPERIKKDWKTLKTKAFYKELARKHYRCYKLLLRLWEAAQKPTEPEEQETSPPPRKEKPSPELPAGQRISSEFSISPQENNSHKKKQDGGSAINLALSASSSLDKATSLAPVAPNPAPKATQADTSSPATCLGGVPNICSMMRANQLDRPLQIQNLAGWLASSKRLPPKIHGIEGNSPGQAPLSLLGASPSLLGQQARPISAEAVKAVQNSNPILGVRHLLIPTSGEPHAQSAKKSFTDSTSPVNIMQLLSPSPAPSALFQAKSCSLTEQLRSLSWDPQHQDTVPITLPMPSSLETAQRSARAQALLASATSLRLGMKRGLDARDWWTAEKRPRFE